MLSEYMHNLYAYNTWANDRIFMTAALVGGEQLRDETAMSFGSIRNVLVHIVSFQEYWLARAQWRPPAPELIAQSFHEVQPIYLRWNEIDTETHTFVDNLSDTALEEVIRYTNPQGEPNVYHLWQILFHQANHAMQHRSEIALRLTEFGHSPGWLDYLLYLDIVATGAA